MDADGERLFQWLLADPKLLAAWSETRGQQPQRPIKVLVAIANPANLAEFDLQPIDAEQEWASLQQAVAGRAVELVRFPPAPGGSAVRLQTQDGDWITCAKISEVAGPGSKPFSAQQPPAARAATSEICFTLTQNDAKTRLWIVSSAFEFGSLSGGARYVERFLSG